MDTSSGSAPGAVVWRAEMFEPLGRTEVEKRTGTGRDMRIIWAIVFVCAVVLVAIVVA